MERAHEDQRREDSIRKSSSLCSSREGTEATTPASTKETPEVFDLRPLSHRRAIARVRKKGPAQFRFAGD